MRNRNNKITFTESGLTMLGDMCERSSDLMSARSPLSHRRTISHPGIISSFEAERNLDVNQALIISLGNKNEAGRTMMSREEIKKKIILKYVGFDDGLNPKGLASTGRIMNPFLMVANRILIVAKENKIHFRLKPKSVLSNLAQYLPKKLKPVVVGETEDGTTDRSKRKSFFVRPVGLGGSMGSNKYQRMSVLNIKVRDDSPRLEKNKGDSSPHQSKQGTGSVVKSPTQHSTRFNFANLRVKDIGKETDELIKAELEKRNVLKLEKKLSDFETEVAHSVFYKPRVEQLKRKLSILKSLMDQDTSIHKILKFIMKDKMTFSAAEKEIIFKKYSPLQVINFSDYNLSEVIPDIKGLQDLVTSKMARIEHDMNRMVAVSRKFANGRSFVSNGGHFGGGGGASLDRVKDNAGRDWKYEKEKLQKSITDIFDKYSKNGQIRVMFNKRKMVETAYLSDLQTENSHKTALSPFCKTQRSTNERGKERSGFGITMTQSSKFINTYKSSMFNIGSSRGKDDNFGEKKNIFKVR